MSLVFIHIRSSRDVTASSPGCALTSWESSLMASSLNPVSVVVVCGSHNAILPCHHFALQVIFVVSWPGTGQPPWNEQSCSTSTLGLHLPCVSVLPVSMVTQLSVPTPGAQSGRDLNKRSSSSTYPRYPMPL